MTLTNSKAQQIANLWVEGRTLEEIAIAGLKGGWTRADAERIAADNHWTIESDGRCFPRKSRRKPPAPVAPVPSAKVAVHHRGAAKRSTPPRLAPPQPFTVQEVASALRVSKMSIYRLIHEGQIRHLRVGRSLRIPVDAYDEYVAKAAADGAA